SGYHLVLTTGPACAEKAEHLHADDQRSRFWPRLCEKAPRRTVQPAASRRHHFLLCLVHHGGLQHRTAQKCQLAVAECRQVEQRRVLGALYLSSRQAGLLVGEQILENTSEPLPAFGNFGLILRSLRKGGGEVTVVILGQFEQPDIGGEGRRLGSLAGCSEHT